ncbi:MAG TPA: RsmD family RNA methyltransferase, partial [Solirubrobacteraceae bacterium]|nr:RsmD family RNA methyltransferase [Solirubrobacteraceae bacterium]
RPTSGRAREAIFSILGDVTGARVLDLFAGSGALGIEALSRGAASAVFAEIDPGALRAIGENIAALALSERASVARADARRALPRGAYDLVFIDPPYAQALELGPILSASLPPALAPGARVVTESDRRTPLELALPRSRERRYGDTLIRIHELPET